MTPAKQDDGEARRDLLLVRHAKSAWGDASLADHDRPLAPRGVGALPVLRNHLEQAGICPDHVLCSSSRRTIDTLDGLRDLIPEQAPIEVDRAFYLADAFSVLDRVRGLGDRVRCAMVVGHNPTMQDLAVLLAGAGDPDLLRQLRSKVPTGAAITLTFHCAWSDVEAGRGRLVDLFMPRPPRS